MSGDMVTVSAKVPRALRERIDRIGKDLGISNRSVFIRKALESFVEGHGFSGIPPADSEIEGKGGKISQSKRSSVYRNTSPIPAKEEGRKESRRHDDLGH